jgi:hypothetical protein
MNFQKRFVCSCLSLKLFLLALPAPAQQLTDSLSPDQTAAATENYARVSLGADSRLYNGVEYIRNGIPAKGSPFFDSDSLQPGTLSYDGIVYRDIPLEYDLVLDKLVIRDYTGKALISLINEKIDHFYVGTHHFRYIVPDNTASSPPKKGIYEVLFSSGPLTLLARHEKQLVFPSNKEDPARYNETNTMFLHLNDRFYRVDGEDDLLEALKDKKDPLKKYIRDNKIHFKKELEKSLIQITRFYLQIKS